MSTNAIHLLAVEFGRHVKIHPVTGYWGFANEGGLVPHSAWYDDLNGAVEAEIDRVNAQILSIQRGIDEQTEKVARLSALIDQLEGSTP